MINPQFVYILIATADDYYAEMAAVSMQTLQLTNPDARIVLLTDQATFDSTGHAMRLIREFCSQIIPIKNQYQDMVMQSRFLKIKMRELIKGDFIYLDTDTLVLGALDTLWETKADFAACLDEPCYGEAFVAERDTLFKMLHWTLIPEKYINFGVALMRDTPKMHEFSQHLFTLWTEQVIKTGKHNDQFALNHLLNNTNIDFNVLPKSYNAQITANPMAGIKAKILHIFTGKFAERNDTVLHVLAKRLKQEGTIDMEVLNKLIKDGDPWVNLDTVRKLTATKHYMQAAALYLKKEVMR